MRYRTLGNTGLKVSALGFGCMRLPMADGKVDRDKATPMIRRAIDAGVNYIDTAVFYCDFDSERAVGDALSGGWREKVVLSTKNDHGDKNDLKAWQTNFENSLERLRVDHIDIYNFHGISWEHFCKNIATAAQASAECFSHNSSKQPGPPAITQSWPSYPTTTKPASASTPPQASRSQANSRRSDSSSAGGGTA